MDIITICKLIGMILIFIGWSIFVIALVIQIGLLNYLK